jgi:hypothetical protein
MNDEAFLQQFEDCTWPFDQWHHRQHIKVAYLYLLRYPSLDNAIDRMRTAIKRYNAAQHVPEAPDRGYHETVTQAWMRLVHFTVSAYGPSANADEFFERHPQLWQFKVLRLFYSQEKLMSAEAKVRFVPPDITELPNLKKFD